MNATIGIDISKDTLDTYWLSKRKHKQFSNNKSGLKELIRWGRQAEASLAVFEATGVYHRMLEVSLAAHDFPFARVNPRQAGRFAQGTGNWLRRTALMPLCWPGWGLFWSCKLTNPKAKCFTISKG
jgi:transposase